MFSCLCGRKFFFLINYPWRGELLGGGGIKTMKLFRTLNGPFYMRALMPERFCGICGGPRKRNSNFREWHVRKNGLRKTCRKSFSILQKKKENSFEWKSFQGTRSCFFSWRTNLLSLWQLEMSQNLRFWSAQSNVEAGVAEWSAI